MKYCCWIGTLGLLVLGVQAGLRAQDANKPGANEAKLAKFAEGNPKQVDSHTCEVKVAVDKTLFKEKDIWIAVIPVSSPGSWWLQGTLVLTPEAERVVHLGLENVPPKSGGEKFQIVILACPKGTFEKDGELRAAQATKLKVEILDSHTILRTK